MKSLLDIFNIAADTLEGVNRQTRRKAKKKGHKKSKGKKSDFSTENIINNDFFSMLFNVEKIEDNNSNDKKESISEIFNIFDDIQTDNNTLDKKTYKNSIKQTIGGIKDIVLDLFSSKDTSSKKAADRLNDNKVAIKLVKALIANSKKANTNEQKLLAKYVGWGGLSNCFSDKSISSELQELLGDDFESAKRSVNTAFYTSQVIVKYMWNVISHLGFEKGRILEPSVGTGNIFRYSGKEDIYYNSKVIAVEMDKITSQIATQLLQSATVINSKFEETTLKDESFDLIISNIPFGNINIYDAEDKELNKGLFVHDYYFLKSIKKVRDKGLIAFITSTGVMDKRNSSIREEIDQACDFLGAVRLPSGSFSDTSITADIIFLQKNNNKTNICVDIEEEDETKTKKEINRDWLISKKYFEDKELYINEYFINNPEMIIGDIVASTNQFGECLIVKSDSKLTTDSFRKTLKYFPSEIYITPISDEYMYEEEELIKCEDETIKDGEFVFYEDSIYQRQGQFLIPSSYTGVRKEKLALYITIKDLIKTLIKEQLLGCDDDKLKQLQNELNSIYDLFISKYGFLNARANKALFNHCILYSMVSALENYNFEDRSYTKADIFFKRTIGVTKEFIPTDIEDAICLSFTTFGNIDITFIADKLNRSYKSIKEELIDKEYIYIDPEYQTSFIYKDEYLSGFVKEKLKVAKEMLPTNPLLEKNIKALELVIPEYVTDISFNFASTWIPSKIKEDFIKQIINLSSDQELKLLYTKMKGYSIEFFGWIPSSINEMDWGTTRRKSLNIVETILNLGDFTVYDTKRENGKDKRVKNLEETQLALNISEKWKAEFVNYINSNADLLKELSDIYNEKFNGFVERKYSNIFKSLNINPNIKLREHQLKALSRMIQSKNNTLLAHNVGCGKTYVMVAYAEEIARIGSNIRYQDGNGNLINKPIKHKSLFIVPNHLCKSNQFAKEYLSLYPQAKILATSPDDFKKSNRRKLISKIALGDWTSVIIPYSVLSMIPLKPSTEIKMLEESLKEVNATLEFYNQENSRVSIKDLEKSKQNFETRIKELSDIHVDEGLLFWEDLGITNIICDEAHNYKNLFFPKKLQVAGVSNSSAKKSQDLFNKIKYLEGTLGDGRICFATATPISNSMVEMYTLMKYLNNNGLQKYGIDNFDAFAANFGEIISNMEIDPTGNSFRLCRRFAKFCNLPELIALFRQIADVVNIQDIEDLNIPKRIDGKAIVVTVKPTEAMKNYINELVERAKKISEGGVNPKDDNMLNVTNEGRKVAVAPRLVGIDEPSPKLMAVAKDVAKIYEEFDGTQLLFCDLGTPKFDGSYSVYDEIKEHCINLGIPSDEIRFIHEAKTTDERTKMIADFNDAKFKILIGSTSLCGEGVNFQKNIVNISHLDVPWKPSSIEQRNGRGFRQGNINEEIFERRYVTNSSFDAYSWQIIEFKSKYINQIISATSSARVAEDLESSTLTYEACKAASSNNPKLLELATVKERVQKLQILEKSFKRQVIMSKEREKSIKEQLEFDKKFIVRLDSEISKIKESSDFSIILDDKTYTNELEAVEKLGAIMKGIESRIVGYVNNLPIKLEVNTISGMLMRSFYVGEEYSYKLEYKMYPKNMLNDLLKSSNAIKDYREKINTEINYLTIDLDNISNRSEISFEYQEELKELILTQKRLENELSLSVNL